MKSNYALYNVFYCGMFFQSFSKHGLVVSCLPGAGPGLWAQMRKRTSPCMWEKYSSSTWESLEYVRRTITSSLTYLFPRLSPSLPHLFSCTSCSVACWFQSRLKIIPSPGSLPKLHSATISSCPSYPISTWGPSFHSSCLFALASFLVYAHFFGEQPKAPRHCARKGKTAVTASVPQEISGQSLAWPPGSWSACAGKISFRCTECVVKLEGSTGWIRHTGQVTKPSRKLCLQLQFYALWRAALQCNKQGHILAWTLFNFGGTGNS